MIKKIIRPIGFIFLNKKMRIKIKSNLVLFFGFKEKKLIALWLILKVTAQSASLLKHSELQLTDGFSLGVLSFYSWGKGKETAVFTT